MPDGPSTPRPPSWRVPALAERAAREDVVELDLVDGEGLAVGLVGIDRHRRPR